jgi:hypothetical protein
MEHAFFSGSINEGWENVLKAANNKSHNFRNEVEIRSKDGG